MSSGTIRPGDPNTGTPSLTGLDTSVSAARNIRRPPPIPGTNRSFRFLGQYRICQEIASGGMATVYLARMRGRAGGHRFVALKCLKPALADDTRFVEMFLDEAEIASRIHHPNVCGVLDHDRQDGINYLAMEYLVGETLAAMRRQLESHQADWPVYQHMALAVRIVADACEGLHAAHELLGEDGQCLDVVHRDVSPENIMVTYDGNVKILDFGVARASQQHHTTRAGDVKGKFSYLAPEILQGAVADRRSDVWGLGVVLWELLTTHRLFRFETDAQTLQAVASMRVRPPSRFRTGIPRALDEIVMKALNRDVEQRYQSARAMGRDLMHFLAHNRISFGPADLSDAMHRLFPDGNARKRRLLAEAAADADDSILDASDVAILEPASTPARRPTTQTTSSEKPDIVPSRSTTAVSRGIRTGSRAWSVGFGGAIMAALVTWRLLSGPDDLRPIAARTASAVASQSPAITDPNHPLTNTCLLSGPSVTTTGGQSHFSLRVSPLQSHSGAVIFEVSLTPAHHAPPVHSTMDTH